MSTLSLPNKIDKNSWFNGLVIGLLNVPFTTSTNTVIITEQDIKDLLKLYITFCFLVNIKKKTLAINKLEELTDCATKLYNRLAVVAIATPLKTSVLLLENAQLKIRALNGIRENDTPLSQAVLIVVTASVPYTTAIADLDTMSINQLYTVMLSFL